MKTIRLALLGFGNAGQAFARLLTEKQEELISTLDTRVLVSAIATHRKGTLLAEGPEGLDLPIFFGIWKKQGRFPRDEGKTALQVAGRCRV
jgi:homoserine dehydrogenase